MWPFICVKGALGHPRSHSTSHLGSALSSSPSAWETNSGLVSSLAQVHQRLKLYQCDICKSSFGQVGTLTRHKAAVHEKRRDHECTYPGCKKRFGSRWTLSVHEVSLSSWISCPLWRCFALRLTLWIRFFQQRNVHEKIKPYVCNFPDCERQFGNAWNQKKHEAQAHSFNHGGASTQLTANVAPVLRRDQGSSSEASGPPMPRLQGVYGSQRPHHHPLVRRLPVPTEQYIHGKAFANSTSTSKFHVDATRRRK